MTDPIDSFRSRTIHIVEVKYCRDTDRSAQSIKAEQQHADLRAALLGIGYQPSQVRMHIITLGATGTVYKDTHATLVALGIDNMASIRSCCAALHRHAVSYTAKLLKPKWAQEHSTQQREAG